nr:MAG TPA: hypothetical protein [Caudoviricetes sp.]
MGFLMYISLVSHEADVGFCGGNNLRLRHY